MKNTFLLFFAILLITSCTRQSPVEEPADMWNGYSKFLKEGEVYHTIWAGAAQHNTAVGIDVGTVTYGVEEENDIGYFYVIYDCAASGWTMSETHMYAGAKDTMPLNKPLSPKIGKFQFSTNHNPRVSWFKYQVPILTLPPYSPDPNDPEAPYGFVVATHCIVRSPSDQIETAWGFGNNEFNDKAWGWYDDYSYEPDDKDPFTVIYGTAYTTDSLKLFHLNMTTGVVTLILKEYVGNSAGSYDGTAFDDESDMFFFVNYDTRELFVNYMGDADPSFSAGTLEGNAVSGTFYNDAYYYINPDFNTINVVTFTSEWMILEETTLDTIPDAVIIVNDIAMNSAGDYLYIVGEIVDEFGVITTELIKYSIADDIYYSYTPAIILNDGTQIAYGSDDLLYAVSPVVEGGSSASAYLINTITGELEEILEGKIIVDDPFADLSRGPSM